MGVAPVPIKHLLDLLHSDVEALVSRASRIQPGDRQLALEILLAGAFHLRACPGTELVRPEKAIDGTVRLR